MSSQGRYEFAYNAARLLATLIIRAGGYRVISRSGRHYYAFRALEAADNIFRAAAANFDAARSKRNDFSYDIPIMISETDAEDLVASVEIFETEVEQWIRSRFPALA